MTGLQMAVLPAIPQRQPVKQLLLFFLLELEVESEAGVSHFLLVVFIEPLILGHSEVMLPVSHCP